MTYRTNLALALSLFLALSDNRDRGQRSTEPRLRRLRGE